MDKDKAIKLSNNKEIRVQWGGVNQTVANGYALILPAGNDHIRLIGIADKTIQPISDSQRSNQL